MALPVLEINGQSVTTFALHFTHRIVEVEFELSNVMSRVKGKRVLVKIVNLLDDDGQMIDDQARICTICQEKGATYLSIVVMDDNRSTRPPYKSPPPYLKNPNP